MRRIKYLLELVRTKLLVDDLPDDFVRRHLDNIKAL